MRQEIAVTVDTVIFTRRENRNEVLLIKRKNDPFKNKWAIPGGFLDEDEDLETAARRELQEETGLKIEALHQLKAYGALNRDPRGRTISIAFIGLVATASRVKAGDDAQEAKWFDLKELPALAFDHIEILEDAKVWLVNQKD